MKAVADRLNVTPMALYRHVTNKADLLDGVLESLITEFELPPPDLPWPSVSPRRSALCEPSPSVIPMSSNCSSSCRPTPR